MSNNVITDPLYWDTIAEYLRGSGVVTYEQDWQGGCCRFVARRKYLPFSRDGVASQ